MPTENVLRFAPLLLLAAATTLAGQSAKVVAIEVQAPPGRSAAEFQRLITQPLGQPVERAAIQASLRALYATGEFTDVEAVEYPAAGGVRLVFATEASAFLAGITFEGSPDPPAAAELQDASGLAPGERLTAAQVAQAVEGITERLRSYNYYQAKVQARRAALGVLNAADLTFTIMAGPLARTGAVQFGGTLLAAPGQLLRVSGLAPGAPLTREKLDAAETALQNFYQKQGRITATVALTPVYHAASNRLDLNFQVTPGPRVEVEAEGYPIGAGTLRQQIPVYEEHATDTALLEEGRRNLVDYLQRRGYFEARVSYRQIRVGTDTTRILYEIQPGPQETLDAVFFAGNHYFESEDLSERLSVAAATPWLSAMAAVTPGLGGAHGRFSQAMAAEDADAIARLYHNNGFAAATVTPEITNDYRGRARHIAVTYTIVEGPQTLVGQRNLEGATPAQAAALDLLLTTAPGQPYSPATAEGDRNTILTYYYNAGYPAAACTVAATAAAGGREDVTFRVQPGPAQRIHDVLITGNQHVRRSLIQHTLRLGTGQPLSQAALFAAQRRLYDSGLFTSVAVVPRNPQGSDPDKDVFVDVDEAQRYTFAEGIGLQVQGGTGGAPNLRDVLGETGYSPLFSFDATRTAMTGRAQTLSFKSAYGTLQKRAVLGYDIPDFLNHEPLRADFTAFYDDTFDIRTFRAIREQAGIELDQTLNPAEGWNYDLAYRRVRVLSPLVAPEEIPVLSQPVEVAAVTASYHLDHRDDPLDTHHGTFNSFQLGLAKTYGAGVADFGSLEYENHWYHPLTSEGDIILAGSTQVGFEVPFGPEATVTLTNPVTGAANTQTLHVLPLAERYLSGGSDSLRGFSINQAGPRDPITGFPVGGEAMLIENLELRFPVLGPTLGGVVFYDGGNVYSTPRQMVRALARWRPPAPGAEGLQLDSDFTSHTAGLGLRYRTPVGPVRFDAGYLLNPPTFRYFSPAPAPVALNQRLPAFHFFFSIGETF